jgi:predicted esterase
LRDYIEVIFVDKSVKVLFDIFVVSLFLLGDDQRFFNRAKAAKNLASLSGIICSYNKPNLNDPCDYSIPGLPQHTFKWEDHYDNGSMTKLYCAGTVGYIFIPDGSVDPNHRWVWLANMCVALPWESINWGIFQHWYVENLLANGFHVVGVDVGTSCGSLAGADIFQQFYDKLMTEYDLNPKTRLIGQSNGGLIVYGWAFRHPELVDRILGILPATDVNSWPGLDKLCPPGDFTPEGLSYGFSCEELATRLTEFNPIDNLVPLAADGVKLYHIHGDADDVVPIQENTYELQQRYQVLGGDITVEVIPGGTHGAPNEAFFESQGALDFLMAD